MKTLITLAALAALTLHAQQTPAPAKAEPVASSTNSDPTNLVGKSDPDRLTPAHAAKWKELTDAINAKTEAFEKAELPYLRAKDALNTTANEANQTVFKMQTEANCAGCQFGRGPDGSLRWIRPQPKTEEKPKEQK
jgi:hypothetical protein